MKKKIILIVLMMFTLLFSMSNLVFGAAVSWGTYMSCTVPASSSRGWTHYDSAGDGDALCDFCKTEHPHTFGSYSVTTAATCVSTGVKTRYCACGKAETATVSKNPNAHPSYHYEYDSLEHWKVCDSCSDDYEFRDHTGGSYADGNNDEDYHYKTCETCGGDYDGDIHTSGYDGIANYGNDETYHWKICNVCSRNYDYEGHAGDWRNEFWATSDEENHYTPCDTCRYTMSAPHDIYYSDMWEDQEGNGGHTKYCYDCDHEWEEEACTYAGGGSESHYCTVCAYVREWWPRHSFKMRTWGGEYIAERTYNCIVCDAVNTVSNPFEGEYWPRDRYTLAGASSGLDEMVLKPLKEKYTVTLTYPQTRIDGTEVTDLQIDPDEVRYGTYVHGSLQDHINEDLKSYTWYDDNGNEMKVTGIMEYHLEWPFNYFGDWYEAEFGWIDGGYTSATQTNINSTTIELHFTPHGNDVLESGLFCGTGNGVWGPYGLFGSLGSPEETYGDILYNYATITNEKPNNNDEVFGSTKYQKGPLLYYTSPLSGTVNVDANMQAIHNAGYRYVGYSITYGFLEDLSRSPITYGSMTVNSSSTASATLSFEADKTAALITFYVEPIMLTWSHRAVNASGDITDLSGYEGEASFPLPEYYNASAQRCEIPVKSLNKLWFPGYILEKAEVVDKDSDTVRWDKEYNDETTTIWGERNIVEEKAWSIYSSESNIGYAKDKHFYYYYNTPTIDVTHINYDNPKEILKAEDGRDLAYQLQILNEYAYIESLITDNIGIPHTLTISNSMGERVSYKYDHSTKDLVQIKIYEVTDRGAKHCITLYANPEYKPKRTELSYDVSGKYLGNFEKYFSTSLIAISTELTANNVEINTNKNWKVEFVYREVERVHISFRDTKGNKIFIPSGDKYIPEITSIIDKEKGYEHLVEDLGNGRYTAVGYTESGDGYEADYGKAEATQSGDVLSIPGNTGDRYIVIFYTNEKKLKVEFREVGTEAELKPGLTLELPTTGIEVEVPAIPLCEVVGYKLNTDYDGVSKTIPGDVNPLTIYDPYIPVPNPEEKDQHLIIYYNAKDALKVDYRDISGDVPLPVPPEYETKTTLIEIPETGTKVEVPVIPGYEVKYYKINEDYNRVDEKIEGPEHKLTEKDENIAVESNGNSQYIIIYYEKIKGPTKKVTVEYREGDPTGPEIKDPITLEIPIGEETPIGIPDIPGYIPDYYVTSGDSTPVDIPDTKPDIIVEVDEETGDEKIIIVYQREARTEVIVEYREGSVGGPEILPSTTMELVDGVDRIIGTPEVEGYELDSYVKNEEAPKDITIGITQIVVTGDNGKPVQKVIIIYQKLEGEEVITPDDNIERVYLRANKQGLEEYDVAKAIPTSEDLYVSGDMYGYRFVTLINEETKEQEINVTIKQRYYDDLDSSGDTESISVTTKVTLYYPYYEVVSGELYDLKAINVENDAIHYYNGYNYDNNTLGNYQNGRITIPTDKPQPSFEYILPEGVGQTENHRIQIKGTGEYSVVETGENTYEITIRDVEYYETKDKDGIEEQLRNEALKIVEDCTSIKVQTLVINQEGETPVEILTGKTYPMSDKNYVFDSIEYYVPYVAGRAPLYSFYESEDLYVKESPQNRTYLTTVDGEYRLVQKLVSDGERLVSEEGAKTVVNGKDIYTTRRGFAEIVADLLNIHTPIVNGTKLIPLADNNKFVQQIGELTTSEDGTQVLYDGNIVLGLGRTFEIEIPNRGMHITSQGYGDKAHNHAGLLINGDEDTRITNKSKDEKMTAGTIYKDATGKWKVKADVETDRYQKGPSFAEYKLIKFPYDVYIYLEDNKVALVKSGDWVNLYEYMKPSNTKYEFGIPVWVEDARAYTENDGIQVLIAAENCSIEELEEAMNSANIVGTVESEENNANNKGIYLLRQTFNTYISGNVYDLQIRDTDDPGFMGKIKEALNVEKLPLAQKGQVPGYLMGLKLGYRFYFDLKTRGISNESIKITPKIYYVSSDGSTVRKDITLYYHSTGSMYNKLSEKDLNVRMSFGTTHGAVNNSGYAAETAAAKQITPSRVFTTTNVIGQIYEGLILEAITEKLPYDSLAKDAEMLRIENVEDYVTSAGTSEVISDTDPARRNDIKNCTGHWYGEYYLPASTVVVSGTNVDRKTAMNGTQTLTGGYLVVAFEEITTGIDETGEGYLTYAAPEGDTQWEKEKAHQLIILPNGYSATIPTEGSTMAIYQVGLRANSDFETEGTH